MKSYRVTIRSQQAFYVVSDTEFSAEEKVLDNILSMSKDELRELLHLISWENDPNVFQF